LTTQCHERAISIGKLARGRIGSAEGPIRAGLECGMSELNGTLRTIYLILAALGVFQCLALLAFLLTIREVQKEIRLLQSIRRSWRLSLEAIVHSTLDRQRKARQEMTVLRMEPAQDATGESRHRPGSIQSPT
jgi:hypothetical protein